MATNGKRARRILDRNGRKGTKEKRMTALRIRSPLFRLSTCRHAPPHRPLRDGGAMLPKPSASRPLADSLRLKERPQDFHAFPAAGLNPIRCWKYFSTGPHGPGTLNAPRMIRPMPVRAGRKQTKARSSSERRVIRRRFPPSRRRRGPCGRTALRPPSARGSFQDCEEVPASAEPPCRP